MEIIELVQDCKLVREGREENGHDCWGNYEWTHYKYVFIDGKKEKCYDGWYVIHDGVNVKETISKFLLECRQRDVEQKQRTKEHLEKTGFETPREYAAYLKGKNENR